MTSFDWSREDNRCFGCGNNPIGLKLEFEREEEWVVAKTELDDLYQGFKNSAHGGIIATLLDEASAWATMDATGRVSPSYELQCEFLKPVPLEEEVTVRAKVVSKRHGIVKTKAEIKGNEDKILAKAEIACRVLEERIDAQLNS
ncbi:MAG: PaaI family thioesterase [Candidatus Bipolaricaulia bacterium]